MISKTQAKKLATRYSAWNDAVREFNDNGICVWGNMLLSIQSEVGIELAIPEHVETLMRIAVARLEKPKA